MAGRRQHAEGSLYRRSSDGRWIAVVHLGWKDGKRQRRVFTGTTPDAAVNARARFLDARKDGFTLPKGRQPYVSEWVLHWLHHVAKRRIEATSWHSAYRPKVTGLIVPYFESVALAGLCEEDLERWHAQLEETISPKTGRPYSTSTIAQAHNILSSALKEAVVRRRMPRNPCSNVSPPQAGEFETEPPSSDEVRQILSRCESWPNGARWVLAVTTGLRQGEALALQWRNVRLAAPASVAIRWSAGRVNGERVVKAPKSAESRRSVPLVPLAVAALRKHKQAQVVASLDDLVFTSAAARPLTSRRDWQDWQNLLADLGLPHYRVHDIRHGYATMLLEQGIDPRVVQAMLGWSTVAMLKKYQHVRAVMHVQVADAVDRATGGESWKPRR